MTSRTRHQRRVSSDAAPAVIAAEVDAGRRLVLVDGLSAAGKSTIAAAVAARLEGPVTIVRGDDFIRPGTTRWDQKRFADDLLARLSAGFDAEYRPWPWDAEVPGDVVRVRAGGVLILEGVAVSDLDPGALDVGVPLVVWVDADDAERARRSRERAPERFDCWRDDWLPVESEWARRVRPWDRADIVVAT